MLLLPNCKINIGLNVVNKRADNYHDIETIFYPIPLRDNLEIKPFEKGNEEFHLTISGMPIKGEVENNLVVRVFLDLKKEFDLPPLDIFLYKNIPTGAGLGGGSSDAAFMMIGLNELFSLNLSPTDMEQRITKYGADCAFFIKNSPSFATGIGNTLTPINVQLAGKWIVLVKPNIFLSTKDAYAKIKPHYPKTPLRNAILSPIEFWKYSIVNDFEESVFPLYPELQAIKQTLYDMGALYAAMSGSGSTLFGIFNRPIKEAKNVFPQHFVFMKKLIK